MPAPLKRLFGYFLHVQKATRGLGRIARYYNGGKTTKKHKEASK